MSLALDQLNAAIDPLAPPIVAELIDVIGVEAYMQLSMAMGGASFYVPRNPSAEHVITRAIGADAAALVGEYFHGQNLVLSLRDLRRRSILALADSLSADQIAAKLQISRSHVYDVIAKAKRTRQIA